MGETTATAVGRTFEPVYHSYGPHRTGLPQLATYFRELWHRRAFATEMSKANMRSAHSNTFFGTAWLVLNPLLLAGVYYLLVAILNPTRGGKNPLAFFAHLTAALFAFTYVSTAITTGATSVVLSGKLLINTAFPRLLMPLSAVRTAFFRFLPTVPVYFVFHILAHLKWTLYMPLALYFLGCMTVFSMGMAAIFSTLEVYFRDTTSFLPYFIRIWLYLSPVLWTITQLKHKSQTLVTVSHLNPMLPMLGGYEEALQTGVMPSVRWFVLSGAWAVLAAVVGFLFFIARERDFAVRVI